MVLRPATNARDYWAVNGNIDFGFIPANLTPVATFSAPVRLQRGDATALWGHDHILADHGHWVKSTRLSIPHLLLTKLSQPGQVYTTEVDSKFKLSLSLTPNSLLILKFVPGADPFFGVTSLYFRSGPLDGIRLGRFPGCAHARELLASNPTFQLLEAAIPQNNVVTQNKTTVTIKKKRNYVIPLNVEVDSP